MAWFVEGATSGPGYVPVSEMPDCLITNTELLRRSDKARAGQPLQIGSLPSALYLRKPRKAISNLFAACGGIPIVSKKLRELVECWEPTPTVFHPVQLRKSKTGPIIDEYYFMNLVRPIDAIIPEGGKLVDFSPTPNGRSSFTVGRMTGAMMQVRSDRMQNRHVWLDVRQTVESGFFISDDFRRELSRQDLQAVDWVAQCLEV